MRLGVCNVVSETTADSHCVPPADQRAVPPFIHHDDSLTTRFCTIPRLSCVGWLKWLLFEHGRATAAEDAKGGRGVEERDTHNFFAASSILTHELEMNQSSVSIWA